MHWRFTFPCGHRFLPILREPRNPAHFASAHTLRLGRCRGFSLFSRIFSVSGRRRKKKTAEAVILPFPLAHRPRSRPHQHDRARKTSPSASTWVPRTPALGFGKTSGPCPTCIKATTKLFFLSPQPLQLLVLTRPLRSRLVTKTASRSSRTTKATAPLLPTSPSPTTNDS